MCATAEGTASNLASLSVDQTERYIYGSSRLGVEQKSQNVDGGPWNAGEYYSSGPVRAWQAAV